jgi:hypothetical protein
MTHSTLGFPALNNSFSAIPLCSGIKLDLTNWSDRNSSELPFAEKTQFSALSQALTLKQFHFHLDLEFLVNLELVESPHT